DAANDRVVSNREEEGISERECCSVLSLLAMACRTILRVQETEVRDLARRKHFRIRPGAPAGIAACHAHQSREDGERDESGGSVPHCASSPSLSSTAPCSSMPSRTARGSGCHVEIRSCVDTTIPATMP